MQEYVALATVAYLIIYFVLRFLRKIPSRKVRFTANGLGQPGSLQASLSSSSSQHASQQNGRTSPESQPFTLAGETRQAQEIRDIQFAAWLAEISQLLRCISGKVEEYKREIGSSWLVKMPPEIPQLGPEHGKENLHAIIDNAKEPSFFEILTITLGIFTDFVIPAEEPLSRDLDPTL
jgi:hypothetical protein